MLGGCGHDVLCFGVGFMPFIGVVFHLGCGAMLHCHGVVLSLYLWLCHICVVCLFGWYISHSLRMGMSSDCSQLCPYFVLLCNLILILAFTCGSSIFDDLSTNVLLYNYFLVCPSDHFAFRYTGTKRPVTEKISGHDAIVEKFRINSFKFMVLSINSFSLTRRGVEAVC